MFIVQKNFDGEGFDWRTFYQNQQPKTSGASTKSRGKTGTPIVSSTVAVPDVTQTTPQPGQPGYDYVGNSVTGRNSVFTQSVINANRQDAGLDPNPSGEKSGLGQAREWLQEKVGKTNTVTTSPGSPIKFDQEALRKQFENQGMSPDQIDSAIARAKASYDAEVAARAVSSQKVATPKTTNPSSSNNKPVIQDKINRPSLTPRPIRKVPVITDEGLIEEEKLPELSKEQQDTISRQVKVGNAKRKVIDGLSKAKEKIAQKYGELSTQYGEGITGSLGTDAALAAGGLALAGGAYHLLKKRRAKKKAEKEALNSKIKK